MGVVDEDIVAVKAAADLVSIVGQYTQGKQVGRRWVGLCPFHNEKSPSFSVNREDGLFHCLSGDTRVVTWDGVFPIRELAGRTVKVLTEKGRWIEAPFKAYGVQRLWNVEVGRNHQRKVIRATDGHRWFITYRDSRYERTTETLRRGHTLARSFPQSRVRALGDLSPYGIAHGITYGDGSLFNGFACVDLQGAKDAVLLKWFPLSRTYSLLSHEGKPYTKVLDLPKFFKNRPSLDEAATYLAGWLAGYLAADGHVAKDGTVCINSAKREDLQFVRDVCTRLGIGTYGITSQLQVGKGSAPTLLFRVHLMTSDLDERFFLIDEHRRRFLGCTKQFERRSWVVKSVERTDEYEEVFCAEVPGSHSFVLEDNILTGNCFGCQKSGDSITFVREIEHLDFVGAVEFLASKAGITLRYDDKDEGETRRKRKRLHDAMEKAVDWYHDRLLNGPDAGSARGYLRSRGFDGDTVRRYRIGWAPDAWDELVKGLKLPDDVLVATGLGFKNRNGKTTDAFRGRLLFPIFDPEGHAVAIGGRILPGDDGPKYKNSPETSLYSKSRILYGLNWHKGEIVGHGASGEAIICEGYTDVIGFARVGIGRAVATCGTALTEEHIKLLSRFAKRIVLAFDADAAGQGAADKFAAWESRYELEVCVADLPPGSDPGDLAQKDPDRLRAAVERIAEWRPGTVGAKPYLAFRLDRVLAAADLGSVEGRARAATNGVEVLRDHPNELIRDAYLMKLADFCRVSPEQLRHQLQQRGRPRRTEPSAPVPQRVASGARHPAEIEALTLLVQQRDEMLPWLADELFVDDRNLAVFWALSAEADVAEALALLQASDPGAAEVLATVAVAESHAQPDDVGVRLHELAGGRRLAELQAEARVAEDPLMLQEPIARLRIALEGLRSPVDPTGAAAEVLASLVRAS